MAYTLFSHRDRRVDIAATEPAAIRCLGSGAFATPAVLASDTAFRRIDAVRQARSSSHSTQVLSRYPVLKIHQMAAKHITKNANVIATLMLTLTSATS